MYHIGILLFNISETKALLPTLQKLAAHADKYQISIIAAGYPALTIIPKKLRRHCKKSLIIEDYLGQLSDNNMYFNTKYLEDILQKLQSCDLVISGGKAIIQQQILQRLPPNQHKVIFFDLFYPIKSIKKLARFAKTLIFTDYKSFNDAKNKIDNKSKKIICSIIPFE